LKAKEIGKADPPEKQAGMENANKPSEAILPSTNNRY
jgi:hypothetical protein